MFSVVMPTYDRQQYLTEAIDSVRAQTVQDWECIVVDDASPRPVVVAEDPRIRVVRREQNGGAPAAMNTGMRQARGRYVAFLDDDDLWTPDRLALALEGLARAPVALCWIRFIGRSPGGNRRLEGNVRGVMHEHLTPSLGATAVRREAILPFDETLALEDVEWWVRMVERWEVATVPRIGYLVRLHGGRRHRSGPRDRIRDNLRLMEMHADYFGAHPRAAAFRWKRVGLMARQQGDHRLARAAFIRSLRIRAEAKTIWHLARSLRRSTTSALGDSETSEVR